ncbi:unnamed protein product, partial [Prorocentrum cordatum]
TTARPASPSRGRRATTRARPGHAGWPTRPARAPAGATAARTAQASRRCTTSMRPPESEEDLRRAKAMAEEMRRHSCGEEGLVRVPGVNPAGWPEGLGRYDEVEWFGRMLPKVKDVGADAHWWESHNLAYAEVDEKGRSTWLQRGLDHHAGCSLSHFVTWMGARSRGLSHVIVAESDSLPSYWWQVYVGDDAEFDSGVLALLQDAPDGWDVIMLDKGKFGVKPGQPAVKSMTRGCWKSPYNIYNWTGQGVAGLTLYMVSGRFLEKVPRMIHEHSLDMVDAWMNLRCNPDAAGGGQLQCYSAVSASRDLGAGVDVAERAEAGETRGDSSMSPLDSGALAERRGLLQGIAEPAWSLSMPVGVNFGAWLCLEDWFFSGAAGEYVDSGWPGSASAAAGQGACLPPGLPRAGEPWKSEGTLTKQLGEDAVSAITEFRNTYITEDDWRQAAAAGITSVRVPITWAAFADALAEAAPDAYGKHDPDLDTVIVPDPFYSESLAFATIPRNFLRTILDNASRHNLTVIWGGRWIHCFMGGSSNGTYNGIWPNSPQFWQGHFNIGNTSTSLTEAGIWIVQALIRWVEEGLSHEQRNTISGLCLMNEPAHLSWGEGWADQEQTLDWVRRAMDLFRWSSLPQRGVSLYVNLVETAFRISSEGFEQTFSSWWREHTSAEERSSWAVMDLHKYWAWDPDCSGCDEWRANGQPVCAWTSDTPGDEVQAKLRGCIARWRDRVSATLPDGLTAISEFSAGTWRRGSTAVRALDLTRAYFQMQVQAFREISIEPFFWNWKMPYGPTFQSGWSLKSLLGIESGGLPSQCGDAGGEEATDEQRKA